MLADILRKRKPDVFPAEQAPMEKEAAMFQPKQTDFVKTEVTTALVDQVAIEMHGQLSYMAMAAWYKKSGLEGFCGYFKKQASEEAGHAQRIIDFLVSSGTDIPFKAVEAPTSSNFENVRAAADRYLELERSITKNWYSIYRKCEANGDLAVVKLSQWFLEEQVQEEDQAVTFVQKVKMAGEGAGLLIMDADLAKG